MSTVIITPNFNPTEPPLPPIVPMGVDAWLRQREIESQHAALHMEAHMRYGLVLPIVIPYTWDTARIADCALGIQRKPVFVATVRRVSNAREKRAARLAGQMGIGVAA